MKNAIHIFIKRNHSFDAETLTHVKVYKSIKILKVYVKILNYELSAIRSGLATSEITPNISIH